MRLVADGKVIVAGTYSGNGIALSAVSASMDYLSQDGVYDSLNANAATLREGLNEIWSRSNISAYTVGVGAMFQLWFSERPIHNYREAVRYANGDIFRIWWEEMLYQGILFHPHYFENLFVSTAHTKEDIDLTLERAERAVFNVEKRI